MAGDIVLGYDGSAGSKAALGTAVSMARAFGAPLSIVFGYEPNPMGGETADYKDKLEKIGKERVGDAVTQARAIDAGVDVQSFVVPLRPVDSLLEAAREREARVIVVGGSGERPIVGALLGSVPLKLLHRSPVPVLVVPAAD
jgi:nucleotide-binding universal stress UspA family protein